MKFGRRFYRMKKKEYRAVLSPKMNFSIEDFFSKFNQIMRIWWYLLKKSLMENTIFLQSGASKILVQGLLTLWQSFNIFVMVFKTVFIETGKQKWMNQVQAIKNMSIAFFCFCCLYFSIDQFVIVLIAKLILRLVQSYMRFA